MGDLENLKVEEVPLLRSEANSLQEHADQVKNITDSMLDLIEQSKSVWEGLAHDKYAGQFAGLSDDMQRIYDNCVEYSTDLMQIADNYGTAIDTTTAKAASLKADVELPH